MRRARVVVGLALVWGALGVLGYRLGWQAHANHGQSALLGSVKASQVSGSCSIGEPTVDGQLAGVLRIPSLGVTAPVESGTTDAVLSVAVGHAEGTPWPGTSGSSVLLAHDVTYFANIGRLVPGDRLEFQSGCVVRQFSVTGHQVVKAGAPIPAGSGVGIVLDTCWPTNALWYTPDRYLVQAVETGISAARSAGSSAGNPAPAVVPPPVYTTPAPAALVATGIDLQHNEEPMGTMSLAPTASQAWAQSPAPLALEIAALQAYFGALHAADAARADWWSAVAPGTTMPSALDGTHLVGAEASPLDVLIGANGDQATSVQLSTVVPVAGGPAPGRYHLQVTEAVHGSNVVITSWGMVHE